VTRRTALQVGALGFCGLGLTDLLRARALAKTTARDETSVIFVWLPGGLSHMESYDMKPGAPPEYRGEFSPIATSVPGIEICELFPQQARIADKFNIVRSMAHEFADHGGGHKRFMTGRDPKEPVGFVNDYPAQPSLIARLREHLKRGIPNYVAGVDGGRQQIDTFSFGSAYLGNSTHPFVVAGDPADAKFQVQNLSVAAGLEERIDDRLRLLRSLDNLRREADKTGLMDAMDEFNHRAFDLLTGDRARRAFDLSQEPDHVRDRFGRQRFGQRGLLALRLVEAGCSFVTMVWENPTPPGQSLPSYATYNWDSHAVNCHLFEEARNFRFPIYDQAVTALVEGLYERGLDKKTLLIITGEFGRTPRVTYSNGRPGRDHWPGANSLIVAGGGMRTGQVIGATNPKGEYPIDRRLTPNDLWATVYRHLGLDPEASFPDHAGRPMPALPFGEPIRELLPQA
jgi:hypothetical protein